MKYLVQEDYDIAYKNGISKKMLETRFYTYGWDKERAITQPKKIPKNRMIFTEDIKRMQEINDLDYGTIHMRVIAGKTLLEAVSYPAKKKTQAVICITTGKKYEKMKDAAIDVGLKSASTIQRCCINKTFTAGKCKITGVRLRWRYAE